MKYVHILGYGSMPTRDFYRFLCDNFDHNEHCIITGSVNDPNFQTINNGIRRIKTYSLETIIEVQKAERIIIHGLINRKLLLFFCAQPWLLHKCNWIVWGGDIYCHNQKQDTLELKAYEMMRKFMYPKIGYVTTLVDDDYEKAVKWYKVKGKHLSTSYPGVTANEEFLNEMRASKPKGDTINIQIGNSATVTNQHYEALDMLSRFKEENIHIYLPLNYGDPDYREYAQAVLNYAVDIFGKEKVTAILERVENDEYSRYLNTINVGVFNNNRQQAMGNISQLIQYGAKIYLRKDTTMWVHFEKLGCKLHEVNSIVNESLEEFSTEDIALKEENMRALDIRNSTETKLKMWKDLFEEMEV